jgi:hypothetical protein
MSGDLKADLEEAEAEGASAEQVLGHGAADARSFAASWAAERGVVPPPRLTGRRPMRQLVPAALAALAVIAAVGAALTIFAAPHHSSPPLTRVWVASARPVTVPARRVTVLAGDSRRFPVGGLEPGTSGVDINRVGSILLFVGIVGIIASIPLLWSSRRT